jgi:hypothetical protein
VLFRSSTAGLRLFDTIDNDPANIGSAMDGVLSLVTSEVDSWLPIVQKIREEFDAINSPGSGAFTDLAGGIMGDVDRLRTAAMTPQQRRAQLRSQLAQKDFSTDMLGMFGSGPDDATKQLDLIGERRELGLSLFDESNSFTAGSHQQRMLQAEAIGYLEGAAKDAQTVAASIENNGNLVAENTTQLRELNSNLRDWVSQGGNPWFGGWNENGRSSRYADRLAQANYAGGRG